MFRTIRRSAWTNGLAFRNLFTRQRFIIKMTAIINIAEVRMRCPRCGARPSIQSATPVRPGFEYLTLRCTSCTNVFDAQVGEEVLLAHEVQQPAL